ncbi:MAG: hypothetical protein KKE76_12590 [Gammaproteobacteria bacterium]|nr:hypothetical protein [Gammaproteobacteria bacterium]
MSAPKLVLYPTAADTYLAGPALRHALEKLNFISTQFQLDGQSHYHTGPAFLDHISFLGCSPAIALEAPTQDAESAARTGRFCHLHLHEATKLPRLRIRPGQRPRCRQCRTDIEPESLLSLNSASVTLNCPGCRREIEPERLNWRQSGAIARIFLDIWGIHNGEAVPGDLLLQQLGHTTSGRWDFFYIED